jgi:UDP-glucose 4-epimerase
MRSPTVVGRRCAATAPAIACSGNAYNVAGGHRYSLLELLEMLGRIHGVSAEPEFTDPRPGDVRHSEADISAAASDLGYHPSVPFEQGLRRTVDWFREVATS